MRTSSIAKNTRRLLASVPSSITLTSGRALTNAIEFATTIYLMRLLGPDPFGLVAMATGLLIAFSIFRDAGAGSSLVSDRKISPSRVGAATLIACSIGVVTMLTGLACTPLVVAFYGDERLTDIWIITCLTLWVTAMGSIPNSLAQRKQRFWIISWTPFFGAVCAAATALTLAQWHQNYWPVVAFQVTGGVVSVVLLWLQVRPAMNWPSRSDATQVFRFGRGLIGFDILNMLNRYADNVIIGAFLGSHALGLYLLAYKTLTIPLREIGGVINTLAYPRLSRLAPKWELVGQGLAQVMYEVALFATPLCAGIALAAPELINVIFGQEWAGALIPLQVLALLGIVQTPFSQIGIAYTVSRNTDEMARWGLLSTPAVVLSFFTGIPWGIQGVAVCYAITSVALLLPMIRIGAATLHFSPWILAKRGFSGIAVGLLAAIPLLATCLATRAAGLDEASVLVSTIGVGALCELGLYLLVMHQRRRHQSAW